VANNSTLRESVMRDQNKEPAPKAAQGSVYGLVLLFILAFAATIALQVQARLNDLQADAVQAEGRSAAAAAAQIDSVLSHAWGAAGGATEAARFADPEGLNPAAIVQATMRARGVDGAALIGSDGVVRVSAGPNASAVAEAANRMAGAAQAWAGAVILRPGSLAHLALLRRLPGGTVVALVDIDEIKPAAVAGARVALVDLQGNFLTGSAPAEGQSGVWGALNLTVPAGGASQPVTPNAVAVDGGVVAVGSASTQVGSLVVLSARPVDRSLARIGPALAYFGLLALAPLAAVGALLMLLRHNVKLVTIAEAEVARADAQVRFTADRAHAGLFEWRLEDNQVELSEFAMRMLNAASESVRLSDVLAAAVPEDRAAAEEAFRLARRTGALDARFRMGTGPGTAWVEARGIAIEDVAGRGASRVVGTFVDVSQRREAEIRASALEMRLREAITSLSGPFALWDSRRRIVLWNKSYASVFGLTGEILRAGATYETVTMAAAGAISRERIDPADPQCREIEVAGGQWIRMVERRTAEGGLVTVGVDITDMKRHEQALTDNERRLLDIVAKLEKSEQRNKVLARQAEMERQKAEDASAAKSAFLANMSHELRTPLNAIIGFSEIMTKELFGPVGSEQYRSYSADIHNSGTLLLELINDVLDMAKIEAGRFNLAPRPLDPEVAIDQALRLMRRRAEEKGLQLLHEYTELPEIEADHRAVKQMLLNLLSNAIKFTDQGAVMVQARQTDTGLEIRVVDTGRGIPAEALPRLAKPFEQVDNELNRNTSGTGLGLALTKSLAEMHGGRLEIESEVGRGTMVAIYLPRTYAGPRDFDEDLPHAAE
jgi:two-component system, cell cycle sensor histidine kinase PleC